MLNIFRGLLLLLVMLALPRVSWGLLPSEKNNIQVFQNSVDAVVNVTTSQLARSWVYGTVEVPKGAGSGFIWDDKGHIVTNYHVVEGGSNFMVSFRNDKKQYKAKLVGTEGRKDIAVLKLVDFPNKIKNLPVGESKSLVIGQNAYAIGSPFGLNHTFTKGIISATGRKIEGIGGVKIHNMIQTDAAINQGNSGGPLLNSSGLLIGMNTMIYSTSGSSAGVGFAVPVDTIKRIVPQLISHGKVIRPGFGIVILEDGVKQRFGIREGIVIEYVDPKSPAARAGLEGMSQDRFGRYYLGDVIIKVDGKSVNSLDDIYHILDNRKIGDTVEVVYRRNRKNKKVSIKLDQISI